MENNEIMFDEIEVMDDVIVADEETGMSTGVAMLIGAGLTLAVGAGVKLGKKAVVAIKTKLAERKAAKDVPVIEGTCEEV